MFNPRDYQLLRSVFHLTQMRYALIRVDDNLTNRVFDLPVLIMNHFHCDMKAKMFTQGTIAPLPHDTAPENSSPLSGSDMWDSIKI